MKPAAREALDKALAINALMPGKKERRGIFFTPKSKTQAATLTKRYAIMKPPPSSAQTSRRSTFRSAICSTQRETANAPGEALRKAGGTEP